jgi:hypothetical protein
VAGKIPSIGRVSEKNKRFQEAPDFISYKLVGDAVLIAPVSTQIPC